MFSTNESILLSTVQPLLDGNPRGNGSKSGRLISEGLQIDILGAIVNKGKWLGNLAKFFFVCFRWLL